LRIGAVPPDVMDSGSYILAATVASGSERVRVHTLAMSAGAFDEHTIFEIATNRTSAAYFANKESVVSIPHSAFTFRNPPRFNSLLRPARRDAEVETAALLDHLYYHSNAPPFLAVRLAQRFSTSNPSPRYVATISEAFTTGSYGGRSYSGRYGDLGAAVAAVVLDREAQSLTLEAEPTHGQLREPLLKLLHLMRAMEFVAADEREVELVGLETSIGMQSYRSPTVFAFFLPEYEPAGAVASVGLMAPEAQLGTAPRIIGALNGMSSMIHHGLTSCDEGFGSLSQGSNRCSGDETEVRNAADGLLTYAAANGASTAATIDQLDLLLTGGRLSRHSRELISTAHAARLRETHSQERAMRVALDLFLLSSEFTATNANMLRVGARPQAGVVVAQGRPYRAIVFVFLQGGADSYNLLVPLSGCGAAGDLFAQYSSVRGAVALSQGELLPINASGSGQVCQTFGVHYALPSVRRAYDDGDAAFIANVGNLVEPTSQASLRARSVRRPPGLFAHNVQQVVLQNLHAQETRRAQGVIGRMFAALSPSGALPSGAPPFKTATYSAAGNRKILEGAPDLPRQLGTSTMLYSRRAELRELARNLTQRESHSIFAETAAVQLETSLSTSESLQRALEVSTVTPFSERSPATTVVPNQRSKLVPSLRQVAKIIRASTTGVLEAERDAFFVQLGAFDTHHTPLGISKVQQLETGLATFADEMRAQGVWNQVTVFVSSEFGRTLTSNGRGTDHGWGGHNWLMGGAVRGGRIHGQYPRTLGTDHALNAGRGRVIPTTSYEAVWHGIAEWMGVEQPDMATVLPNVRNFMDCDAAAEGCRVYDQSQLFE